jgi:hypothetical protein
MELDFWLLSSQDLTLLLPWGYRLVYIALSINPQPLDQTNLK